MAKSKDVKEHFEALYAEWEKTIQDPKIQFSSRPQDYTDNEPYRAIVKLGEEALPLILERIEQGIFFMNQAALDIRGLEMDRIIEEERKKPPDKRAAFLVEEAPEFLSEQQKSALILKNIRGE